MTKKNGTLGVFLHGHRFLSFSARDDNSPQDADQKLFAGVTRGQASGGYRCN